VSLSFGDIPAGTALFLDANTFVYAHSLHPQFGGPSARLLERIERQELSAFTSAHVLGETSHRLMTLEACTVFGWPFPGIAARLRRHPTQAQTLALSRRAIDDILRSAVRVLAIDGPLIAEAGGASRRTGLLTNDALVVAVMQRHGLAHLASHDADFDRVPGADALRAHVRRRGGTLIAGASPPQPGALIASRSEVLWCTKAKGMIRRWREDL
jgi:predicted nucleic acid-binding protein